MTRCFRYLFHSYLKPTLAMTLLFGMVSATGSQLLNLSFFDSYFMAMPMVAALSLFIYSINLSTCMLEIPLSMGSRRRDLFAAILLAWLLAAALCLAVMLLTALIPEWLDWGMVRFPAALGWKDQSRTGAPFYLDPATWPVLFLLNLMIQAAGTCSGCLFQRYKALGILLILVCSALGILLVGAAFLLSLSRPQNWGDYVPIFCLAVIVLTILFALLLGHFIRRATVR